MTAVVRKIRTALQRQYQKPGGIRVPDAVEQARQNLTTISGQCIEGIDLAIGVLAGMTADQRQRPTSAELRKMHQLINEMLACCAPVEIDGFAEALYAVARLVGALMTEESWLDGALTPAVNLLRLVRGGGVTRPDLQVLIAGIDQCASRVIAHARVAQAPPILGREPPC